MRTWTLTGAGNQPYKNAVLSTLGGHRHAHIYDHLDCAAVRRTIARGGYVHHHVFFLNETDAHDVGYRPYAVCIP